MIGVYKTHPVSYATAAHWLDLPADRIMLVSTHDNDIQGAHAAGFRTAYVDRPREWWDMPSPDPGPSAAADLVAADLVDLADRLGMASV